MASPMPASWNRVVGWLRQIDGFVEQSERMEVRLTVARSGRPSALREWHRTSASGRYNCKKPKNMYEADRATARNLKTTVKRPE